MIASKPGGLSSHGTYPGGKAPTKTPERSIVKRLPDTPLPWRACLDRIGLFLEGHGFGPAAVRLKSCAEEEFLELANDLARILDVWNSPGRSSFSPPVRCADAHDRTDVAPQPKREVAKPGVTAWALARAPPFLRAKATANLAVASKSLRTVICHRDPASGNHSQVRLCHVNVHPNSHSLGNAILSKVHWPTLQSIAFYLPQVSEALDFLDALSQGPVACLQRIVDKQSRWTPRELPHASSTAWTEDLCPRFARLTEQFGRNAKSLRHLEGPIFTLVWRATHRISGLAEDLSKGTDSPMPARDDSRSNDALVLSPTNTNDCTDARHVATFFERLETIHLMEADPFALGGVPCMLTNLTRLVLLNLPKDPTPNEVLEMVASVPKRAPRLSHLQIDFAYFSPSLWDLDRLELTLEQIASLPTLKSLILDWSRLGDQGCERVCRALTHNHSVTELSMAHCELRQAGPLAALLRASQSLKTIDLSANNLDDKGAQILAEAMSQSSLRECRMRDSHVSLPLPVKTEWYWGCSSE